MDEDAADDRRHAVHEARRWGGAADDKGEVHAGSVGGGDEDEVADRAWRGGGNKRIGNSRHIVQRWQKKNVTKGAGSQTCRAISSM